MAVLIRPVRNILRLLFEPYLYLSADPALYVPITRPEDIHGPISGPPSTVRLTARVGQRGVNISILPPELFSSFSHARFEVMRIVTHVNGATDLVAVADSGPDEVTPAVWSWRPGSAGYYRFHATSNRTTDSLVGGIPHYIVPLAIKLEERRRQGGAVFSATVTNKVPDVEIPGTIIRYGWSALRVDIPDQVPVWRSLFDVDDQNPTWDVDLPAGRYVIWSFCMQWSADTLSVAEGDQALVDFVIS